METDINIPKTKAVNIFTQYCKMLLMMMILSHIITGMLDTQTCSLGGTKLLNLNYKGSIALLCLNVVSLLFVWLKDPFARLEFFVMYAVNICWSAIMLAQTYLDMVAQPNECAGVIQAEKLIVWFHIIAQLEVLYTFCSPIPFAFRTIYLPTTLYPLYLIFTATTSQMHCSKDIQNVVMALVFLNVLLFGIGVPLNFALLCSRKPTAPNLFRFLLMIGFIGQGGVLAITYQADSLTTQECVPTALVLQSYLYIAPIALFCALSLMMSLPAFDHTEIRQKLLNARVKPHQFPQQQQLPQNMSPQKEDHNVSVINDGKSMYGTVIRR